MSKTYTLCICRKHDAQIRFGGVDLCQSCLWEQEKKLMAEREEREGELLALRDEHEQIEIDCCQKEGANVALREEIEQNKTSTLVETFKKRIVEYKAEVEQLKWLARIRIEEAAPETGKKLNEAITRAESAEKALEAVRELCDNTKDLIFGRISVVSVDDLRAILDAGKE